MQASCVFLVIFFKDWPYFREQSFSADVTGQEGWMLRTEGQAGRSQQCNLEGSDVNPRKCKIREGIWEKI